MQEATSLPGHQVQDGGAGKQGLNMNLDMASQVEGTLGKGGVGCRKGTWHLRTQGLPDKAGCVLGEGGGTDVSTPNPLWLERAHLLILSPASCQLG